MVIGGTGILNAVPNHDRSRPDTYLCQRDPAAVSGPSPGPDPGTSPLFEIITKTVRRPMPVFFRTDQGAKFLQPTIYMAESTLFAHLYADDIVTTTSSTRLEYRFSTPMRLCEIRLIFRHHSILSCNVMRSSPSPHVLADSK